VYPIPLTKLKLRCAANDHWGSEWWGQLRGLPIPVMEYELGGNWCSYTLKIIFNERVVGNPEQVDFTVCASRHK
jgi:hypothetical protein